MTIASASRSTSKFRQRSKYMRRIISSAILLAMSIIAQAAPERDIIGRWDLQVEPGPYPSWIGVSHEGNSDRVQFLWMGGGVENPPDKARVDGNTVMFRARDMNSVGTAKGDEITGTATEDNGHKNKFSGRRFVPDIDVTGKWTLKAASDRGKPATVTFV